MAIKDTDRKARANYAKKCKQVNLVLYPTDADILAFFERTKEPVSTLIKRLIREEIARQGGEQSALPEASAED